MLPRQGKAHFCRNRGHKERGPKHPVQGMGWINVIRAPYGIGPGKTLVRVADGVSFIQPHCRRRQGKRQNEGNEV